MKSILFSTILVLFSLFSSAQNEESITIGNKAVISSKVLNENRTIWIYTPNITSPGVNPDKRFPVLYLLDGDAHFYSTVGIVQQLSQANGNGVLPEMIVVAIQNTNRTRDLVPSLDVNNPNPFKEFLASELIPFVDKHYKTAPYKMLVGHSLGGLTVIDMLGNFPELFDAYIAIDPSMWFNNEKFLNNTIAQFPNLKMNGKRLFVGTANTMPAGMTLSQLKNDVSYETQHIRSIFKLDDFLKTNRNGLVHGHKYYEAERHNTVPLLSVYDGLRFIFDFFHLDLSENDFADSSALIASKLKTHYAVISENLGYENAAPDVFVNYIAYEALGKSQFKKAQALFELNTEWYPDNANVLAAYADYYVAVKDTSNAIKNYEKALKLNHDPTTAAKLNAITQAKTFIYSADDLQKYAGLYTLVDFNLDMKLEVRDNKLWAIVPGQQDSEFLPVSENVFTVKGQQGYIITFQMSAEKPAGFTSVQPNGTFKAVFKNK